MGARPRFFSSNAVLEAAAHDPESWLHHMPSKSQQTLLPWSEVNQCCSFMSRDRKMAEQAWGQPSFESACQATVGHARRANVQSAVFDASGVLVRRRMVARLVLEGVWVQLTCCGVQEHVGAPARPGKRERAPRARYRLEIACQRE